MIRRSPGADLSPRLTLGTTSNAQEVQRRSHGAIAYICRPCQWCVTVQWRHSRVVASEVCHTLQLAQRPWMSCAESQGFPPKVTSMTWLWRNGYR